jgi:hypothetical protein
MSDATEDVLFDGDGLEVARVAAVTYPAKVIEL